MEPILAIFGVGAAVALWIGVQGRRGRFEAARRAMDACGITDTWQTRSFGIPVLLQGSAGALSVSIETYESGADQQGYRIAVSGLPPLTLRRETLGFDRHMGAREIVVGDDVFDDAVYVDGPAVEAMGLLDAATRARVRRVLAGVLDCPGETSIECKVGVFTGCLRVDMIEQAFGGPPRRLAAALAGTLAFARHLADPRGPSDLARNAEEDPVVEVRIANLRLLAREFPGEERTREALRAAGARGPDELRLAAALLMGDEGRALLTDLAFGADEDRCAAAALTALAGAMPADEAVRLLQASLAARRYLTAHACLLRLFAEPVPHAATLIQALNVDDVAVASLAATALGAGGAVSAEAPLLEALGGTRDPVRISAARALGRVGSAHAVLPLKQLAEAHTYTQPALRRAARQAVAEIQSRLGPAAPGQLSVVAETGGAVSITPDGGEVSLPPEEG